MSTARKQRWMDVRRGPGGCASPRKYGLNGCMPAVVSSTDWSSAEGTSEAEGTARCPRSTKKSVKLRRISSEDITEPARARFYEVWRFRRRRPKTVQKRSHVPRRSCRCGDCEAAGDP